MTGLLWAGFALAMIGAIAYAYFGGRSVGKDAQSKIDLEQALAIKRAQAKAAASAPMGKDRIIERLDKGKA